VQGFAGEPIFELGLSRLEPGAAAPGNDLQSLRAPATAGIASALPQAPAAAREPRRAGAKPIRQQSEQRSGAPVNLAGYCVGGDVRQVRAHAIGLEIVEKKTDSRYRHPREIAAAVPVGGALER
jgi:hypothetical protein